MAASLSADAQFFTGLAFDVKWQNSGTTTAAGVSSQISNSYGGEISPQVGYQFNPKFMVGARINFIFDKSYLTAQNEQTKVEEKYISSSLGWDVAPFCRYRIAKFGKNDWFTIWADFHMYYGVLYPNKVEEPGYTTIDFNKKFIYGTQLMPSLGFRITEKSTLFVNFALLSLGYSGTCTEYDGKYDYENRLILFTGKLSGLFSALASEGLYGIKFGMIRTF